MKNAKQTRWLLKITVRGTSRISVIRGMWDAVIKIYEGKMSGADSDDHAAYIFKLEAER